MPSSSSDRRTCSDVGRPPGLPKTRCTVAAIAQPRAKPANTSFGYAVPRYIGANAQPTTSNRPTRRVGRVTYGSAARTTATRTASRTAGKRGGGDPRDGPQAGAEAGVLDDELPEQAAGAPGQPAGEEQVAGQAPPPTDERGADDEPDRPEGTEAVHGPEHREEPRRERVEEVEDGLLGVRHPTGVAGCHHQQQYRHHDPDPVGGPPAVRLLGRRTEGRRPEPTHPVAHRVQHGHGGGGRRHGPTLAWRAPRPGGPTRSEVTRRAVA